MRYHSSDYPISWFKDRHLEDNLVLRKPFLQRRLVWKHRQKSHLIESIMLSYPIPEIFVQLKTTPDGKSTFVVVDGQQRIASILAFLGINEDDPDNGFELKYVENESPWSNLLWVDFTEEQKTAFYGHLMTARILDDASDEQVRDLFRRLNKYLTKLSDQELRNATYSGPLIEMSETEANDEYWSDNKIVTPEDIRRMRDIEFISELIIGMNHGPQGGSARAIDEFYGAYEDYPDDFPRPSAVRKRFKNTLSAIQGVLPDIRDTRWSNKTDFYTLFVATAELLVEHRVSDRNAGKLRSALEKFAKKVALRLANEKAAVPAVAAQYVRAHEKGSSDKARRAARHSALLEVISPYFSKRRS